jgi:hypothetical protein
MHGPAFSLFVRCGSARAALSTNYRRDLRKPIAKQITASNPQIDATPAPTTDWASQARPLPQAAPPSPSMFLVTGVHVGSASGSDSTRRAAAKIAKAAPNMIAVQSGLIAVGGTFSRVDGTRLFSDGLAPGRGSMRMALLFQARTDVRAVVPHLVEIRQPHSAARRLHLCVHRAGATCVATRCDHGSMTIEHDASGGAA